MDSRVKKTIKELPKIERPREKLIQYGPKRLSNSELFAILLRSGKRGENVVELASKILKRFGAKEIPRLTFKDLKSYPGLGQAKACEIVACFELGKRLVEAGKILGIEVVDHIIVTKNGFMSFKEKGLI